MILLLRVMRQKVEVVKDYFRSYNILNSDFTVNLASGDLTFLNQPKKLECHVG